MSCTSHAHHAPIENLFVGPYAPTSPAYIQSLEHATILLIVTQVIMVFEVFYAINNPPPFILGGPVTITIGCFSPRTRGMGYALYGMTGEFVCSNTSSSGVKHLCIVVELHMIPGHFMLKWEQLDLQVWSLPPAYTRFIQPHAFLESTYQHKPYENCLIPKIQMCYGIADPFRWIKECLDHSVSLNIPPASLIPPPLPFGAYPHYPSQGIVINFEPIQLLRPRCSTKEAEWSDLYRGSAITTWDAAVTALMKCAENNIHLMPPNVTLELLQYIMDDDQTASRP